MKKFTLLLSAMLLALATNLWAETATFDWTGCQTDVKNAEWSTNINDITLTFAKGTNTSNTPSPNKEGSVRMYTGTTLTISADAGYVVTGVEFTATSNNYNATNLNYQGTALTGDSWTLETPTNPVLLSASNNARFKKIVVSYEANGPIPPTLTADPKEINLSTVFDAETGAEGETTVKISGKNLVEGGKINLSLNYDESSDCTWEFVAPESKEIEVTNATVEQDVTISYYAINAGTYTATLTITATDATSADIATVSIPVSLNVVTPYTIGWSVNGTITKTTLVPGATLKDIMPATVEVPSECSDKAFVGWCTTSTVAENGEGIVYVNENTIPEGDATYYAVFAKGSQVEGEKTIEFVPADYVEANNITIASNSGYDCSTMTIDEITITADGGSTNPRFWKATNGTIDYRIYNGCTITISTSIGELTNITVNNGTTYQFQIVEDKKTATYPTTTTVKITSISTTIKTLVSNYSEYATTCKGIGTEIENAVAPAAIRKTIENGQLVIIIEGVKYNAQGVRLQ